MVFSAEECYIINKFIALPRGEVWAFQDGSLGSYRVEDIAHAYIDDSSYKIRYRHDIYDKIIKFCVPKEAPVKNASYIVHKVLLHLFDIYYKDRPIQIGDIVLIKEKLDAGCVTSHDAHIMPQGKYGVITCKGKIGVLPEHLIPLSL